MKINLPEQDLFPYSATGACEATSVLVLAPHADDEVFGCGGSLALHAQAETPIKIIVLTDGAFGLEGGMRDAVIMQREQESRAAAVCLGYSDVEFWRLPDRGLIYDEALVEKVREEIVQSGADLVYAPSLWEISPDHRVTAMAAAEAVRRLRRDVRLAFYEVGAPLRPNRLVDISSVLTSKQSAMRCFESQLARQGYDRQVTALNQLRTYSLSADVLAAEAFEVCDAEELALSPGRIAVSEYRRRRELGAAVVPQDIPLVSVMIRSVNRTCLDDALDSIAFQTWPNIEVVVVSALGANHRPLGSFCGAFPLRLVLPKNAGKGCGRSVAANHCLKAANGDYLLFLDDDDRLDPDHIASLVEAATAEDGESRSVAAYSGVRVEDERNNVIDIYSEPAFDRQRLLLSNFLPIHAVLFPQKVTKSCRFDPELTVYEDWDFWLQVSEHVRFRPTGRITAIYRAYLGSSGLSDEDSVRKAGMQRLREKWLGQMNDGKLLDFAGVALQRACNASAGFARRVDQLAARIAEQDVEAMRSNAWTGELQARINEQDKEAEQRNEYIDKLKSDIHFWMKEAERVNTECIAQGARANIQEEKAAALEQKVADLEKKAAELEAKSNVLDSQIRRLKSAKEQAVSSKQRLLRRIDTLYGSIENLQSSRLWRATQKAIRASASLRGQAGYSNMTINLQQVEQMKCPINPESASFRPIDGRMVLLLRKLTLEAPQWAALAVTVDIIVPVYNGFEFLLRLLGSLDQNTRGSYRLIIIDDCSTDERVWPLLQRFAIKRSHVVLLKNTSNLGFVRTVNRAAALCRNHVVIVNSDVELPPDWLARLMRPIIADPSVASATPFTNAGTICSFPDFCVDNPIYRELSVADLDHFFTRIVVDEDAVENDIPTGVGFCMAMNRLAIEAVGMFDAANFPRGYGEENDWCLRATEAGFRHVLVPNLFIYHKHGGSFPTEEKQRLIEQNLRRLNELHPGYDALIQKYVAIDPLRPLRQLIRLIIAAHVDERKPVLIFDHNLGGGANHYRRERVEAYQVQGMPVLVYYEHFGSGASWLEVFLDGKHQHTFQLSGRSDLDGLICHVPIGEIVYNEAVFYANAMGVPDHLCRLKAATGARLIILLHDYYPVCPSYTLLDAKMQYCGVPTDLAICRNCLPSNAFMKIASDPCIDIDGWREHWGEMLDKADEIIVFSTASAAILERAYPELTGRCRVEPHHVTTLPIRKARPPEEPLHIGVIGAINQQKGSYIIAEMQQLIEERHLPIKISIIGDTDHLPLKESIEVTGRYDVTRLADIVDELGVNFALMPSIWPETFSYVTSELIALDLPLACFNLGAPAERVLRYKKGLVISKIDAKTALDEIWSYYRKTHKDNYSESSNQG